MISATKNIFQPADTEAVIKFQALWRGHNTRLPYFDYYVNVYECENCGHSSNDPDDVECPVDQGHMYCKTTGVRDTA